MRLTARERWPSVAGLVFVVLLVPAFIIGTAPEAETSDETILDYYTDSGNQAKQVVAAVILAVAVISFLVFVSGLRQLLVDARVSGALRDLTLAGGLAFAIMALTGISIGTAVPATFVFSDTFELDPDTARVVLTMGNIWLLGFAGVAGSVLVAAVSLASRTIDLLPNWLTWAGIVAAPAMVLTLPAFGLPTILLVGWVVAVSVALLVRSRAAGGAPTGA